MRDVFTAGGRSVHNAMLPRPDVDFLDASTSVERARALAWENGHTRYPVMEGTPDRVIGFVHSRDLTDPVTRSVQADPGHHPNCHRVPGLQTAASGADRDAVHCNAAGLGDR